MALQTYYPEMGQTPKAADITATSCWGGKHYRIKSKNPILVTRGIEFIKTFKPEDLTEAAQHKVGWHEYKLTNKAFEKLCEVTNINYEMLLD